MKLYIISNYKKKYPQLKGSELTDALIRLCVNKPELIILRTKSGKPYSETLIQNSGLHFSVSHSKDIFACVLADKNIGLDIQHRRKINTEKLAKRFFTEEEAKIVSESKELNGFENDFFRLWARKEAYCKYTGEGLSQAMGKIDVLHRDDVDFFDLTLEDEQDKTDCFCSVCLNLNIENVDTGETIDEIQIFN